MESRDRKRQKANSEIKGHAASIFADYVLICRHKIEICLIDLDDDKVITAETALRGALKALESARAIRENHGLGGE